MWVGDTDPWGKDKGPFTVHGQSCQSVDFIVPFPPSPNSHRIIHMSQKTPAHTELYYRSRTLGLVWQSLLSWSGSISDLCFGIWFDAIYRYDQSLPLFWREERTLSCLCFLSIYQEDPFPPFLQSHAGNVCIKCIVLNIAIIMIGNTFTW